MKAAAHLRRSMLGFAALTPTYELRHAAQAASYSTDKPGVQPASTGVKGRSLVLGTSGRRERSGSHLRVMTSGRFRAPLTAASRSCAVQGLFFGDFLLAPQKKVTALPGAHPGMGVGGNPPQPEQSQ
ncbi:hypothetical protein [Roseateles asaccharophilus]|uniref:Uncharacterized protein n=1 Tax=Roseateles asaccharophilus TaxID=582607 RepID=A0ABU2A8C5_9BURK|nr:hypothetical protein [Roseateles asaccharophilus]MDR7333449.1 hypothetical protein [Roseateles asaccharophilus]